jgi:hypothetical protein
MSRLRPIPTREFRSCKRRGTGRRQGGQVECLANVAWSVAASVFMLVQERATRREVEKSDTGQQGQRATRGSFAEEALHELHATPSVHFTLPF